MSKITFEADAHDLSLLQHLLRRHYLNRRAPIATVVSARVLSERLARAAIAAVACEQHVRDVGDLSRQ